MSFRLDPANINTILYAETPFSIKKIHFGFYVKAK